tara:strand:+ start:10220 stop:10480 length:261 start_codon:yes stop_codon:yes gene_type:complete
MKTFLVTLFVSATFALAATADPPRNSDSNTRSRFYDFGDQVIDGQIRRPTGTFTDARERAKFNRLLRLKRSFLPNLYATSKERVFK